MDNGKDKAVRFGTNTAIMLGVLTIIEFIIAVATQMWVVLAIVALIKAIIVLRNFMHIGRAFRPEGGH